MVDSSQFQSEAATWGVLLKKKCFLKFRNFHRKTHVLESLLKKVASLQLCWNETQIQVLSCEICEILKNTLFIEYLRWLLLSNAIFSPVSICQYSQMHIFDKQKKNNNQNKTGKTSSAKLFTWVNLRMPSKCSDLKNTYAYSKSKSKSHK